MALFLQEAAAPAKEEIGIATFSEAFEALFHIAQEGGALTEALLIADYSIERQLLGEAEEASKMEKVKEFAKRAAAAVGAFLKRVWAKIKQIASFVARKVKEWVAKAKGAFKKDAVSIKKSNADAINSMAAYGEAAIALVGGGFTSIEQFNAAKAKVDAKKPAVDKGSKEMVEVKVTVLEAAAAVIGKYAEKLASMQSAAEAEANKLEAEKDAAAIGVKSQVLRAQASAAAAFNSDLVKAAKMLSSAIPVAAPAAA